MSSDPDQLFSLALNKHLRGELNVASQEYMKILAEFPNHSETLHHLGLINLQLGDTPRAIILIKKSLSSNSRNPNALSNLGYCLTLIGEYDEAIKACRSAINYDPENSGAWTNLGNAQRAASEMKSAEQSFFQALKIDSKNLRYLYNYGNILFSNGKYGEAEGIYKRCLDQAPRDVGSLCNLAACYLRLKRPDEALALAKMAVHEKPGYAEAWNNIGNALFDLRRFEEALDAFDSAIKIAPKYSEVWGNRGNALCELKRIDEALASYSYCLELNPDYSVGWNIRGVALYKIKRYDEAVLCLQKAISLNPNNAAAYRNLGNVFTDLRKYEEALRSFEMAFSKQIDLDYLLPTLIHAQMRVCDWTDLGSRCELLKQQLLKEGKAIIPFIFNSIEGNPELLQRATEKYVATEFPRPGIAKTSKKFEIGRKIRIGYFSPDFREHPVAYLVQDLFEFHDRDEFEIYGFSLGPDTQDLMRKRLEGTFDTFLDFESLADLDIVRKCESLHIDIAIDLAGHTKYSRPLVFLERVAPIQVNYLGFPGTWGHRSMDYLIADSKIVTDKNRQFFTERVVYMPDSFLVNPSTRPKASPSTRRDYGLPRTAFVFCCFNNNWKMTPETFYSWMVILRETPNSVLWLFTENDAARVNIIAEAKKFGVTPSRIVFAERVTLLSDHLSRYLLADLFLDTSPWGAHTTASDALWMGLPVLTLEGDSFPSRVAASILSSLGLRDYITSNREEYIQFAINCARDPQKIKEAKSRLSLMGKHTRFFDTKLYAKNLESAYQLMIDRLRRGLPPADLRLPNVAEVNSPSG